MTIKQNVNIILQTNGTVTREQIETFLLNQEVVQSVSSIDLDKAIDQIEYEGETYFRYIDTE